MTALRLVDKGEVRTRTALRVDEVDLFYRFARNAPEKLQQRDYSFLMREGLIQRSAKTLDGWTVTVTSYGKTYLVGENEQRAS